MESGSWEVEGKVLKAGRCIEGEWAPGCIGPDGEGDGCQMAGFT